MPVRLVMNTGDGVGALALMPAHLAVRRMMGYKAVTVFPGNDPRIEPTHQAAVALLDPSTGRLFALVDGTSITEIRTAAVSAVATRVLARPDASIVAIIGAGAQARTHVEALAHVRHLTDIRIWSRNPARAAEAVEGAALSSLYARSGRPPWHWMGLTSS
jgi:ornithine cyclodeaminase/alanine dehydrogenase-like protein (mu-crystallin family)